MIGIAIYKDSLVVLIDKIGDEYLVNWGGPIWVPSTELAEIKIIKGA